MIPLAKLVQTAFNTTFCKLCEDNSLLHGRRPGEKPLRKVTGGATTATTVAGTPPELYHKLQGPGSETECAAPWRARTHCSPRRGAGVCNSALSPGRDQIKRSGIE